MERPVSMPADLAAHTTAQLLGDYDVKAPEPSLRRHRAGRLFMASVAAAAVGGAGISLLSEGHTVPRVEGAALDAAVICPPLAIDTQTRLCDAVMTATTSIVRDERADDPRVHTAWHPRRDNGAVPIDYVTLIEEGRGAAAGSQLCVKFFASDHGVGDVSQPVEVIVGPDCDGPDQDERAQAYISVNGSPSIGQVDYSATQGNPTDGTLPGADVVLSGGGQHNRAVVNGVSSVLAHFLRA